MQIITKFKTFLKERKSQRAQQSKAQGMLEFALVLPILLLLVLGIIEFGRLLFVYASVTSASREAARYGSAVGEIGGSSRYADCTGIRDAAKRVGFFAGLEDQNILIAYDDGTNLVSANCPPTAAIDLADRISVTVAITYTPIVPLVPLPSFPIVSTTGRTIIKDVGIRGTPPPTPTPPSGSGFPALAATKRDSLDLDADANGYVSPGDRIQYEIIISNNGTAPSNSVIVFDNPDPNTTLVIGSVTASQGTINLGNSSGDTAVDISLGTIVAGAFATITFDVTIDDPFPGGVLEISNQAQVSSAEFGVFNSDDPDTGDLDDATKTSVVPSYELQASKSDDLQVDADDNGLVNPGDTLRYSIGVVNLGNGMLTGVDFTDTPDANTTLVAGSVTTTAGSVVTGNGGGDTTVEVDLGDLMWGASATITFDVVINEPFPDTITEVANQGVVDSNETSSVTTDDPGLAGDNDATVTIVSPAPATATATATPDVAATPTNTLVPTATSTPTPTPTPRCDIVVSNVQTSDNKISWSVENTGDVDLRLYRVVYTYKTASNGVLYTVAFGNLIWEGNQSSTVDISEGNWKVDSEANRNLLVGAANKKTLAFGHEKKNTSTSSLVLDLYFKDIDTNGGTCNFYETWRP